MIRMTGCRKQLQPGETDDKKEFLIPLQAVVLPAVAENRSVYKDHFANRYNYRRISETTDVEREWR